MVANEQVVLSDLTSKIYNIPRVSDINEHK